MALLHSSWLYITLPWLYSSLLDCTWLYITLPWLYFTLLYSTLLYHGSTSLYITLPWLHILHSTFLFTVFYCIGLLYCIGKIDHTPKSRRLFGSTCNMTEESSCRGRRYCTVVSRWVKSWYLGAAMYYNEFYFRLSGVGSPCWLGVHRGLPKECELWCHDKRWFLSWWQWWEQLM